MVKPQYVAQMGDFNLFGISLNTNFTYLNFASGLSSNKAQKSFIRQRRAPYM